MEQNLTHDITIQAGADLSAAQYKVVTVAGTIAAEADTAIGVLLLARGIRLRQVHIPRR